LGAANANPRFAPEAGSQALSTHGGSAGADAARLIADGKGSAARNPLRVDLDEPSRFDAKRSATLSPRRAVIGNRGMVAIILGRELLADRGGLERLEKLAQVSDAKACRLRPDAELLEFPQASLERGKRSRSGRLGRRLGTDAKQH
jgi:hypothetical protein